MDNDYIGLKEIINDVVYSNKILLEKKSIVLINKVTEDLELFSDKVHFTELISNIIKNSIEAVLDNGTIEIEACFKNKYLVIVIKDNGCGIRSENIKNISQPFFTTKGSCRNFGLGLYYCRKVIEKYEGFIEITSQQGVGTEIFIFFPLKNTRKSFGEKE